MAKECSNSSCSKESCEGCPSKAGQGKPDFHIDLNADSSIKHVIGAKTTRLRMESVLMWKRVSL